MPRGFTLPELPPQGLEEALWITVPPPSHTLPLPGLVSHLCLSPWSSTSFPSSPSLLPSSSPPSLLCRGLFSETESFPSLWHLLFGIRIFSISLSQSKSVGWDFPGIMPALLEVKCQGRTGLCQLSTHRVSQQLLGTHCAPSPFSWTITFNPFKKPVELGLPSAYAGRVNQRLEELNNKSKVTRQVRGRVVMKPPFSGPRVHFCLLCSAYKAQGCWFIEAWAAFGWTKSLGDIASRQREGTSRVKAQRQEYAGHVLGASWWGWGWGFRSRSWRYKESCRDRPGLCGYKWQKIQLLLAELRRKCISSSEWSAQGSPLWTRVRRGPDLKGKMFSSLSLLSML